MDPSIWQTSPFSASLCPSVDLISGSTFIEDGERKAGGAKLQSKQNKKSKTVRARDWTRNDVRMGEEYETKPEKIIDFLEPFAEKGDGHLWCTSIAKHRIHLERGSMSILEMP